MKTYLAREADLAKQWWVVDAEGKALGRVATRVATVLRGKHKPEYAPHMDAGDFVVVVNADKVTLSGRKWSQKRYYRYSGYIGGLREATATDLRDKHPERLMRLAVKGMLPKTRLGRRQNRKLKIYAAPEHPHEAQQPKNLEI